MAIEQALTILGWYENLPKDEVPPEYLWEDSKGLEQWWGWVTEKRDSGMAMPSHGADEESGGDGEEMVSNDLARLLKE